jgi:hypothetical protein
MHMHMHRAGGALSIDIPHPNPHPRQVDAIDKFDSCHEAVFEVLEAARCTNSRLGQVSS